MCDLIVFIRQAHAAKYFFGGVVLTLSGQNLRVLDKLVGVAVLYRSTYQEVKFGK